jgi:hypothetical protein
MAGFCLFSACLANAGYNDLAKWGQAFVECSQQQWRLAGYGCNP